MRRRRLPLVRALVLAAALALGSPSAARADSGFSDVMASIFDVALLRPLGFVTTLVGAGLFVPAALVTLPTGKDGLEHAWDVFITTPVQHTFKRPLGEF